MTYRSDDFDTIRVEIAMKQASLTLPELALIATTRAALGAGVALLLSDRMTRDNRRKLGWTLVAVGVVSTLPLAADIVSKLDDG